MILKFTFIILCLTLLLPSGKTRPYYDDYFLPKDDDKEKVITSENKLLPTDYDDIQEPEKPTGFTCGLCLVVDEEFSLAYNLKDDDALKSSMSQLVEHSSWIFRGSDWNNDGRPDNIGFKITRISFGWKPYKKETIKHYETPKHALDLLKIFSRLNFDTCCLGVGFTNRPFYNGLDGIAFGASDRLIGGICDHRNPREEFMINMNTLLISGRGVNKTQLTSFQVAKALVHELGHSFGVHAHDNDFTDPECWGFRSDEDTAKGIPDGGRYIMWSKGSRHSKQPMTNNSLRFSRCSMYAVNSVVSKRRNRQKCFDLDYNPFCGNGIIEGVEECDCGNEFDCEQQRCCGSRKSKKPCIIEELKSCAPAIISRVGAGLTNYTSNGSRTFTANHIIVMLFYVISIGLIILLFG